MGLIPYQGYYHTVEVEEEHYEMEAKFDKRFLFHMTHISFKFYSNHSGRQPFCEH